MSQASEICSPKELSCGEGFPKTTIQNLNAHRNKFLAKPQMFAHCRPTPFSQNTRICWGWLCLTIVFHSRSSWRMQGKAMSFTVLTMSVRSFFSTHFWQFFISNRAIDSVTDGDHARSDGLTRCGPLFRVAPLRDTSTRVLTLRGTPRRQTQTTHFPTQNWPLILKRAGGPFSLPHNPCKNDGLIWKNR